jgi:hypothetical protein
MWPLSSRRENSFFHSAPLEPMGMEPTGHVERDVPAKTGDWKALSRYAGLVFFSAFLALFMIESTDPTRGFLPIVLDPPPAHSQPRGFEALLGVSRLYPRSVIADPRPLISNSGDAYVYPPTEGLASWYGYDHIGRKTADGGWFDPEAMTAAHRTLPFGTLVRVTRLDSGASVEVSINDRGPYVKGRIIDLSRRPASELGIYDKGIVGCRLEVLRYPAPRDRGGVDGKATASSSVPVKRADPEMKTVISPTAEISSPPPIL